MKEPLRLLLVEDSEHDAYFLLSELRRDYEIVSERVDTSEAFVAALDSGSWDIVVSDYFVPGFGALQALALLKEKGLDLPFIVVSGLPGEEKAVEVMRAGARDYVMKDNLARLRPAIERELKETRARRGRANQFEVLAEELRFNERVSRESEERFKATFEQAAVGMAHIGTDGRWLQVNRKLCDIVGYTCEELLGITFQDIIHPDDLDEDLEQFRQALDGTLETYSMEKRYLHKSGAIVWINLTVSLIRGPSGEPEYFVSVIEDITERRRIGADLRASRDQLEIVLRGVGDGIAAHDASGRLVYANGVAARILGYPSAQALLEAPPQEMLGKFDVRDEAGRPFSLEQPPGKLARRGESASEALMRFYPTPDEERWAAVKATPVFDEQGRVALVVNIFRDFTERKRADEVLRKSEERYRTFLQQSTEGVWRFELEQPLPANTPEDEQIEWFYRYGYLAECNVAMAETYGSPRPEEIVGARLGDLFPSSVPENVECLRAFVRSGYRMVDSESREIDYRGAARTFLNNLTGIFEDGSLVRAWGTKRDVSERRRVEETLRQSEEIYRTVVEQAAENIFLVDMETRRIIEANAAFHRSLGYACEEVQQMTLYDVVVQDRESIDRNIRHVVEAGRAVVGERKYRRKDGSIAVVEVSVSAILYENRKVMCVIAHEITERKLMEDDLRRNLGVLLALHEAGRILTSSLDLEEIGTRLLEVIQRVSSLTTAVISLPDESQELRVWRAIGLDNLWSRARYSPEVQAPLRAVLETGDHRVFRLKRPEENGGALVGLCLPLLIQDRPMGLLEVYGPEELLEENALEILGSMSNQAASALENAQLYGELAEREKQLKDLVGKLLKAQEEERRRIAYEVHDDLTQVATATHLRLEAFARRHPQTSEKSGEDLERILGLARRTVGEARRVVSDLRPVALDDFGLAVALEGEIEKLRDEGWRVDYEQDLGDERLPAAVETALFRVGQEGLTNARKHAQARRARLELRRGKSEVVLEVRDWGRGFDPNALGAGSGPGERVGISGMRERIGMLDGELDILSRPGEGTRITARVPLSEDDPNAL